MRSRLVIMFQYSTKGTQVKNLWPNISVYKINYNNILSCTQEFYDVLLCAAAMNWSSLYKPQECSLH